MMETNDSSSLWIGRNINSFAASSKGNSCTCRSPIERNIVSVLGQYEARGQDKHAVCGGWICT